MEMIKTIYCSTQKRGHQTELQAYCTRTGFVANEDFALAPYKEELQLEIVQRMDNSTERDYIRENYKKIDLYVQ